LTRHLLTVGACLITLTGAAWAETFELRFEDLPRLVRERNPAFQASNLSVEASQARTGYLNRSLKPQVSAAVGAERFQTGRFSPETQPYGGTEATLNVFRGGRDRLEEAHRQGLVSLAETSREQIFRQELSKTRGLYWQLVTERERVTQAEALLTRAAEVRKSAQRRVARGLTTNTDVLAIDLYIQQLQEQRTSALHEMFLIQMALRPPLQTPADAELTTPGVIPHDHVEAPLGATALASQAPAVTALKTQAEMHKVQSEQSRRWWMPALDVYGQYALYTLRDRDYLRQSDRWDWATGVRAKLSLFDAFQSNREATAGKRLSDATSKQAGYERETYAAEVRIAQEEMKHLHELIHGSESYLEQAQKLLQQTLSEYDRGLRTAQEVLGAIERLAILHSQNLNRRYEYQKTKTRLLALVGE